MFAARREPARSPAERFDSARDESGRPDERADDAGVFAQLRLAAASVGGFDLAPLAERLSPTATWDDIVLPDDAVRQLREICSRVDEVYHVLGEWGFGSRFSRGLMAAFT